jgi:hypothetical protein
MMIPDYAITHNLTPFISMQNHYSLLYREEEREMMPTLKVCLNLTRRIVCVINGRSIDVRSRFPAVEPAGWRTARASPLRKHHAQ